MGFSDEGVNYIIPEKSVLPPIIKDVTESGSAEASYYTWVDQFDTFGLGATGNMNDALLALVDGKFVVLRVPYPIGYFTKWMDGRIDDPNTGWKGKELWTTYSTRTMFHLETGKAKGPSPWHEILEVLQV
jgi:hypothetical protein